MKIKTNVRGGRLPYIEPEEPQPPPLPGRGCG